MRADILPPLPLCVSSHERATLEMFLKELLGHSEAGYVLYGNKPICFLPINNTANNQILRRNHYLSTVLAYGADTWQRMHLPCQGEGYILHVSSKHLLLINCSAFYQAVNNNLTLFQYVLGPQVSAQKLLEKIIAPASDLFAALNHDKALIGIVLGFGVNNALHVRRQECIEEGALLTPSFGYASIEEEKKALDRMIGVYSKCLERECPQLLFGGVDTEETRRLVREYENVQLAIIHLLESPDFFKQTLERFYGVPISVQEAPPFMLEIENVVKRYPLNWGKVIADDIYAQFIAHCSSDEEKATFNHVIEGMHEAERRADAFTYAYIDNFKDLLISALSIEEHAYLWGFKIWAHFKSGSKLYMLEEVIKALNSSFSTPQTLSDMTTRAMRQIMNPLHLYLYSKHQEAENAKGEQFFRSKNIAPPNKSFYESTSVGLGRAVDLEDTVRIKYKISTFDGILIGDGGGNFVELDLKKTISGLREGLLNMREGSCGTLYLHPDKGFSNSWSLPIRPFTVISVQIKDVRPS